MSASVKLATPLGTNQNPWHLGLPRGTTVVGSMCSQTTKTPDATTYLHIVRNPVDRNTPVQPIDTYNLTTGAFLCRLDPANQFAIKFYGLDAALETGEAYVFGVRRMGGNSVEVGKPMEWCGDLLAKLTFTIGATPVNPLSQNIPSRATDSDTVKWADVIAATTDKAYGGWTIYGDSAAGSAVAQCDAVGYEFYIVVLKNVTTEACGFMFTEV